MIAAESMMGLSQLQLPPSPYLYGSVHNPKGGVGTMSSKIKKESEIFNIFSDQSVDVNPYLQSPFLVHNERKKGNMKANKYKTTQDDYLVSKENIKGQHSNIPHGPSSKSKFIAPHFYGETSRKQNKDIPAIQLPSNKAEPYFTKSISYSKMYDLLSSLISQKLKKKAEKEKMKSQSNLINFTSLVSIIEDESPMSSTSSKFTSDESNGQIVDNYKSHLQNIQADKAASLDPSTLNIAKEVQDSAKTSDILDKVNYNLPEYLYPQEYIFPKSVKRTYPTKQVDQLILNRKLNVKGQISPYQVLKSSLSPFIPELSSRQNFKKFPSVDVVIGGIPTTKTSVMRKQQLPRRNKENPKKISGLTNNRKSLQEYNRYDFVDVIIHEEPRSTSFQNKQRQKPLKNPFWKFPKAVLSSQQAIHRPQRQFDVSTVKGLGRNETPYLTINDTSVEVENKVAEYYPQSSSWKDNESFVEKTTIQTTSTIALPRIQDVTTTRPISRVKEIEDPVNNSNTDNEDTAELKKLVAQLSQTLKLLKVQEEQKRRTLKLQKAKKVNSETDDDLEEEPEVIYVNIWNKVDGELKLTGQKPMLKDTFDEMQKRKDFSSLVKSEVKPYHPQHSHKQGVVVEASLERPILSGDEKPKKEETLLDSTKSTLQKGDIGYEQFVNRQASFLLNSDAKLDLPPSLIGLLPNTIKPSRAILSGAKSNSQHAQEQIRVKPIMKSSISLPIQGVGAKFIKPSFSDTQAIQDKDDFQRFLMNPLIKERPFDQSERTTKPPNFTPIPVPEVLRPSKLNSLPSGLDSALAATTKKPIMVPFEAKYGLKPPSQLSGWFGEMYEPVNEQVKTVESSFRSPSQVKVPSVLDLYGNFGSSDNILKNKPKEKKIIALEVNSSYGCIQNKSLLPIFH